MMTSPVDKGNTVKQRVAPVLLCCCCRLVFATVPLGDQMNHQKILGRLIMLADATFTPTPQSNCRGSFSNSLPMF